MITYLGLGSNLGSDKTQNIRQAIRLINEQAGRVLACSSFIESTPWGFCSDNMFLNAVIAIDTPHSPHKLLDITQSIERGMGRTHKTFDQDYTDRIIDIDILLYGNTCINDSILIIPHPFLLKRDFVYAPLLEIAPDIIYPTTGTPLATLIEG